jgi:hypothetical protein
MGLGLGMGILRVLTLVVRHEDVRMGLWYEDWRYEDDLYDMKTYSRSNGWMFQIFIFQKGVCSLFFGLWSGDAFATPLYVCRRKKEK